IGWTALAGSLAWRLLIKPLGWDKYIPKIDWDALKGSFSWEGWFPKFNLGSVLIWPEPPDWWLRLTGQEPSEVSAPSVADSAGFGALPLDQQEAAKTVERVAAAGPLPTPGHLQELELGIADINAQIAEAEAGIANLGDGPMAGTLAMPYQDEIRALTADLQEAERELAEARARSVELGQALKVLSDTQATPEINTTSVDEALAKVARLSSALRSLPGGGGAVSGAAAPPVQARAKGGKFNAGWLITGEDGPELEYKTEGGYIAHNRALRAMLAKAKTIRELTTGLEMKVPGGAAAPALATVAAGAPGGQRGPITFAPQYNMPLSFSGGVDMEEVRAAVRAELGDAEERARAALRGLLHD
ncbi:MAG: hypothetical protein AAF618_05240, partial [Pseudomonadota bacterium]